MPVLHWLNRETALATVGAGPYRLLNEECSLRYGDPNTQNLVIQGDNLEALRALLPYYAGQVKCIYIDPPYNIGAAFEHYDDNVQHSEWLNMMYPRLELLRDFLREDGSIWVSIDDSEGHYMKVLMDEVFGRKNFVASIVWQKRYSRENREAIGDVHEYILVYSPNPELFKKCRNRIPLTGEQAKVYRNPNNDPNGRWRPVPMTAQEGHATSEQFYEVVAPSGKVHKPPKGRCWGVSQATYQKLLSEGRIYFGKNGDGQPNIIRYLSEVPGVAPWTWWPSEEVGHTDEAKKEIYALFGKTNAFDTPKPERLIERILHIATNPGDLVLDSFVGSGTTAAVAHKMGRNYVGIEMGEHAQTLVVPRLQQVINGEQGGISQNIDWNGGGGFRFLRLGEPLFDEYGLLSHSVGFLPLAAHIWFSETGRAFEGRGDTSLLGIHNGTAYYLVFDGRPSSAHSGQENVLTEEILSLLPPYEGPKVIYAAAKRLGDVYLEQLGVTFRQLPHGLKTR